MVRYEVAIILQSLPKDKLTYAFRSAAMVMLKEGALLRQFCNLGYRRLPYRIRAHDKWHKDGSYLVCDIEAGPQMVKNILNRLRDNDSIIRASMIKPND